jgi:hypothetical protein
MVRMRKAGISLHEASLTPALSRWEWEAYHGISAAYVQYWY